MQTVNQKGLAQIADILRKHHRDGERIADDERCVAAWAWEVEYSLDLPCGSPTFEISYRDTLSGHTETHELDDDCIEAPLLDRVIEQMQEEIKRGDHTAIEGLLGLLQESDLINYLPEE